MTPSCYAPRPPWTRESRDEWKPPSQVATIYNKTTRTVQKWCVEGFWAHLGISVYRDVQGRWWIHYPYPD
jgi:hypothetical protein